MITKVKTKIIRFRFRIAPHEIMKSEYPDRYYKFRNEKVAKAFAIDSCGNEVKVNQL
jgi:hypothetical protein